MLKSFSRLSPLIARLTTTTLAAGFVICLAFTLLWNLEGYPSPWFDEGEFLQIPKNLVQYGVYAMKSSEGFRHFDSAITTGPTVLIAVAAAFKVFGIGLLQARLVTVAFAALALLMMYFLAKSLVNRRAALVAVGLMAVAPWTDFVMLSRQLMGEVAALALLLLGFYLWFRSIGKYSGWLLTGSGVAFGLAILAKPQCALIWPCLVIVGLADRFYFQRLGVRLWLAPLVISGALFGGWYVIQLLALGSNEFLERLQSTNSATGTTLFMLSIRRILSNVNRLAASGFVFLGIPSLVYQLLFVISRRRAGVKDFALLVFVSLWFGWYVFASVGWDRYAFAPLAISSIFVARLFSDLTDGFEIHFSELRIELAGSGSRRALGTLVLMLVPLLIIGFGLFTKMELVAEANDRSVQMAAAYLDENVDSASVIETWDWQIAFFSDRNFHHPPFPVLEAKIREMQMGEPYPAGLYNLANYRPDYLVEGPFSRWTGLYANMEIGNVCSSIAEFGPYEILQCNFGSRE